MKTRLRRGLYCPELLEARIAPATIIVTVLADSGPGSLRQAVLDANDPVTHPGPDTITFDKLLTGTIKLTTAEIAITDTLTIKGPGIDLLTVSGDDARRIFKIDDGDNAVLHPTAISGLTFIDGKAAGDGGAILSTEPLSLKNVVVASSFASGHGGGVAVDTQGKVSIAGSRIVNNQAGGEGGGVHLFSVAGISVVTSTVSDNTAGDAGGGLYAKTFGSKTTIVIDRSIFAGNTSTNDDGGGLAVAGPADGRIFLKNSLVTGNSATGTGGGLYFRNGNLVVTKATFSGNKAASGGGLADNSLDSLSISSSRFLANQATAVAGGGGGGLYLRGGKAVTVAGTIFSGNTSASDGGAFAAMVPPAVLNITGSSFLGNTAADDGGAIVTHNKTVLNLKGSVLSGNIAAGRGGAIYADTGSVLNASGNTFTENRTALYGGAIHAKGSALDAVAVMLSGNLFRANVAAKGGGAVYAKGTGAFSSKGDKVLGNVANDDSGGGFYLGTTGGIFITGSLFQSNVAASSGGGLNIGGNATLTGIKVLDNIAGPVARGGGLRISGGIVVISKSAVTGNVASDGGGIFYNIGTTTLDAATRAATKGNAAASSPNIGSACVAGRCTLPARGGRCLFAG